MANGFVPPKSWKSPEKTLVVASSPRGGSTYVCRLLDTTGLTRGTREYFNDSMYDRRGGLTFSTVADKLGEIDRMSRTDGNLISMKLFPPHMITLLDCGLTDGVFPNAHYVFLRRQDLLGQAISYVRAMATGRWNSGDAATSAHEIYDHDAILKAVHFFIGYNAWWELYFAANRVPVLRLVYEDVEKDPVGSVKAAIDFFGFDPKAFPVDFARVTISRQRDHVSEEWRARFQEAGHEMDAPSNGQRNARTLRNFWRFLNRKL